ncbi:MAG: choice-of-anchor J domain-containing protein [Bacteroidales bacterium]|nr:choice-of-anchor J domain-containing protein [Bacteroidales bacterium]
MKKILLNLFLLLAMAFGTFAQTETLTVNDGDEINEYVPVYGYYTDAYLKCEFVIPSTDLATMANGTITSMKFYLETPAEDPWEDDTDQANFLVFLKEVPSATLSSFYGTDGATVVYEGMLDGTQSEMEIAFTNDFVYEGGNLLIGIYNTSIGNYSEAYFYGVEAENACVQGFDYDYIDNVEAEPQDFLPKTTFTYIPGVAPSCPRPINVMVSNVEATSASISWTPRGSETSWQICVNGDEANIINVTETTYLMTNLDDETDYTIKVRANCGEEQSSWGEVSFTTPSSCPDPENYEIEETTNASVTISWDGTANSYAVRYAPANIVLYEDFENGMPIGWTTVDADGDGHNWIISSDLTNGSASVYGHDGTGNAITSQSFDYNDGALYPNNWLITSAIELPSNANMIDLQFYASAQDMAFPAEHYGVYVSTTTTELSAFTLLWEETMDSNGGTHRYVGTWGEKNTDLTAYAGQTVYIALRHFNTSDQFYLNVDEFAIYAAMPEDWTVVNTTETSIELTGLNANTTYLYQLNSICNRDHNNTWTTSTFTTDQNTYTINATAGENGTINPSELTVVEGENAEFTITANEGYRIASVIVDATNDVTENVVVGDGVFFYTFTNVNANHTIHATFEAIPVTTYTITVNAGENGTVTYNGEEVTAPVVVEEGSTPAFVITPADNYHIGVLSIDGEDVVEASVQLVYTYTFESVVANHTLSVSFVPIMSDDMIEAGSMSIYPNPNNGMFSIDFSNIDGDATYQLIDARGAVVETREINVTNGEIKNFNYNLRAGAYFVRIINGDKVYVEQIVVE